MAAADSQLLIETKGRGTRQKGGFVQDSPRKGDARLSFDVAEPVEIDGDGRTYDVDWAPVPGANAAEVASASISVRPAARESALGTLSVATDGASRVVTIPAGRRIRFLTLGDLKRGSDRLRSQAELSAIGRRLVVTVPDGSGGWSPPLFSVPPVNARGMLPAMLVGASYSSSVLRLPDLMTAKVRLTVASNDFPEDFSPDGGMTLGTVTGVVADYPLDLELVDPDDTVLWSFPGEMPPGAPEASADLKVPVETALNARLGRGDTPAMALTLRASRESAAFVRLTRARGALLRQAAGVHTVSLAGAPAALTLPGPVPGNAAPDAVTADLVVSYAGERLLPTVSDALPEPGTEVRGAVVDTEPVLRTLPPQALAGWPVTRIGLIGRAPEACSLVVGLVSPRTQAPVGTPATLALEAGQAIDLVWALLPQPITVEQPVAISLRATAGRFFWAGEPEPLVRLAISDPDPGGRPLKIGGATLLEIAEPEMTLTAASLPASAFRNGWPMLSSELFLDLEVADPTLRYDR